MARWAEESAAQDSPPASCCPEPWKEGSAEVIELDGARSDLTGVCEHVLDELDSRTRYWEAMAAPGRRPDPLRLAIDAERARRQGRN